MFGPVSFWWVLGFVGLGLVVGWISVRLIGPILEAPVFRRRNYRDAELGIASGLAIALAYLAIAAMSAAVGVFTLRDQTPDSAWVLALVTVSVPVPLVIGFALLGLVDDLGATGNDRGFGGHLRALRSGRLTTGSLKLFGGGALGLMVTQSSPTALRWLLGAAAVALGANLGNLFDRAPGRCLKVGALGLAAVIASTIGASTFVGPQAGCLLGVLLALLPADLAETSMLGDAGSNVVGASVAFLVVVRLGDVATSVTVVFVVLLLVLNLASEAMSFSSVIDGVGPLRWIDRLGATPERKAHERTPNGPQATGAPR